MDRFMPSSRSRSQIAYSIPSDDNRGVMAKVLDCDLEASEFELQSRYYVHFLD